MRDNGDGSRLLLQSRRQPGHSRPQRLRGLFPVQSIVHSFVLDRRGYWLFSRGRVPAHVERLRHCCRSLSDQTRGLARRGSSQGTTRQRFEELYQRYPVNAGQLGEDVDLLVGRDGFMPVREAPTGFMVIKRQVFERLIANYPELRYVP